MPNCRRIYSDSIKHPSATESRSPSPCHCWMSIGKPTMCLSQDCGDPTIDKWDTGGIANWLLNMRSSTVTRVWGAVDGGICDRVQCGDGGGLWVRTSMADPVVEWWILVGWLSLPTSLLKSERRPSCLFCVIWNNVVQYVLSLSLESMSVRSSSSNWPCFLPMSPTNVCSPEMLVTNFKVYSVTQLFTFVFIYIRSPCVESILVLWSPSWRKTATKEVWIASLTSCAT